MLLELTVGAQRVHLARPAYLSRVAAPPVLDEQRARQERLKQLFGSDYKSVAERGSVIRQPREQPKEPEWKTMLANGTPDSEFKAERLTAWLQDRGVAMDSCIVVAAEDRLALVTASEVPAGGTLFEVPDKALLQAEAAFADPGVGRDLRIIAAQQPGAGFDTFAIATLLAAERVRRGSVVGKLRRREGGLDEVLTASLQDRVLPEWSSDDSTALQSNGAYAPFIACLAWPAEDECSVGVALLPEEQAAAIAEGSQLIERLIGSTARNAWTQAAGRSGLLAPPTSAEDCSSTATQALLLAMQLQLDPPPPLGGPADDDDDTERWGGEAPAPVGPALCPLADLVLLPSEARDEARDAGALNAVMGRPRTGRVDSAIRCIATRDLPAGTVVLADVGAAPGAEPAARPAAPGDRVRVLSGKLEGAFGAVLRLRAEDQRPIVRLEGEAGGLVVFPAEKLAVVAKVG